MKKPGTELGNLAARFFAYAQLKGKDIVRTGELAPILRITAPQERDLLRRLSVSGWIIRLKRGVYLVPPRIPAGGKYSPGVALILKKLMSEKDGRYQICGPTAFNFYGFDDQVPSVTYVYNNRISGSRGIGKLAFQFIKVGDGRLGSIETVATGEGTKLIYSSKPRTLVDAVYDWSRFNSLPKGYDWIKQETKNDSSLAMEIVKVAVRYGNQATMRRIGYLLDALPNTSENVDQLRRKLSGSKSLIPWIPGIPAKGSANRKWGLIVNE